mmetsp:Transcript_34949/g.57147  ORF Transcript_34949/g.57147 Transcript_34949/m.57147 type:complete len:119 (-) Transcript_34949:46-402(-)
MDETGYLWTINSSLVGVAWSSRGMSAVPELQMLESRYLLFFFVSFGCLHRTQGPWTLDTMGSVPPKVSSYCQLDTQHSVASQKQEAPWKWRTERLNGWNAGVHLILVSVTRVAGVMAQ